MGMLAPSSFMQTGMHGLAHADIASLPCMLLHPTTTTSTQMRMAVLLAILLILFSFFLITDLSWVFGVFLIFERVLIELCLKNEDEIRNSDGVRFL